jgi:hypothetical protein
MEQIILAGIISGIVGESIPWLNYVYALVVGFLIGGYSLHFAPSFTRPFFMAPLFMFLAYIIADQIDN